MWAVISNDIRNEETDTFLGARLLAAGGTSPTRAALADDDPLIGFVSADHIATLHRDNVNAQLGTLAPSTQNALSRALHTAMP